MSGTSVVPPVDQPLQQRLAGFLHVLFFVSGAAALCYQVMWQRLLFAWFGVDLESMTVIVSVFMFGLGIGAHLGGEVADRWPDKLPAIFGGLELAIGSFGLVSAWLIGEIGALLAGGSLLTTAFAGFLLLAIPTIAMGATLPILVIHVNHNVGHIGHAVGGLYFANTLGAALGAAIAGFWALDHLGIDQILAVTACANLTVGMLALLAPRGLRRRQ
jgi:predicted membrane-bound spermidine synthase